MVTGGLGFGVVTVTITLHPWGLSLWLERGYVLLPGNLGPLRLRLRILSHHLPAMILTPYVPREQSHHGNDVGQITTRQAYRVSHVRSDEPPPATGPGTVRAGGKTHAQ